MRCRKCEIEKDLNEFPKSRRVCKKCASKANMEWAKSNKEKVLKNAKKFRENNQTICKKRSLDHYYANKWKYREWREKNKDKCRQYSKKYRERNLEIVRERKREHEKKYRKVKVVEYKARKEVHRALKKGVLEKAKSCRICGLEKKLEAHHMDYTRPLEITWVCSLCHGGIHMMLNKENKRINLK